MSYCLTAYSPEGQPVCRRHFGCRREQALEALETLSKKKGIKGLGKLAVESIRGIGKHKKVRTLWKRIYDDR